MKPLKFICFVIAEAVPGSAAWLGRGLSCVCAQRRDSDANSTFDLTPAQVFSFPLFELEVYILLFPTLR